MREPRYRIGYVNVELNGGIINFQNCLGRSKFKN